MKVKVVDGTQHVYPIHPGRAFELHGEPGDLVSLIPLGGDAEGVHTSGLEYPLAGERLSHEQSRGISNRLVNTTAQISITRGTLLCVVIHGGEKTLE